MMYRKPPIKYTEMAMYIDSHAYDVDLSEEVQSKIFEYLWHLAWMLAYKAKYFQKYSYYQDFALYVASEVFMRLRNPRQFEFNDDGVPRLKKIKSILNYLKKILYPKKVDFEQLYYDQTFDESPLNIDSGIGYSFADELIDSIDDIDKIDFQLCLDSMTQTIKNYIYSLPSKQDSVFSLNLYLSCLLTFLSSITPRNIDLQRLQKLKLENHRYNMLEQLVSQQFTLSDVILFHLDNSYQKYVFVLIKRIKHIIANDLSMITHNQISSQSALKSMIITDIIEKGININNSL